MERPQNIGKVYWRGFTRLVVVIGILVASLGVVFLAIYGAVRLAERFGLC